MALPGQIRKLNHHEEHQCEDCLTVDKIVVATHSLCTESDSFGSEYTYLCDKHIADIRTKSNKPKVGCCQFCNTAGVEVSPFRDPDEGSHGPVYNACSPCRKRIIDDFCGEDD